MAWNLKINRKIYWILIYTVFVICIALVWIFLAPRQVGGNVFYVIVYGNSMEPLFKLGDLVLLRPSINYKVNDTIAYFNPNLNNYIFHRIIDVDANRYILKGDNNAWIDAYQPQYNEILGKLWLRIPYLGKVFQVLRNPVIISLGIGSSGLMLFYALFIRKDNNVEKENNRRFNNIGRIQIALSILIAVFLFALFLAIISYSKQSKRRDKCFR